MCYRKIEMDETRQQRFGYPETGLPVPRICNTLNDFSGGRVDFHWHKEFQFGLVLKGSLDYLLFPSPGLKVQNTLTAGDGFLSIPRCFMDTVSQRPGPRFLYSPLLPVFLRPLWYLEISIRK